MVNSPEEIIESIKKGKMVVIMDDEKRENEGDLIMAAQFVKSKHINFMASQGKGLICLTLTAKKCKKLGLSLIRKTGESPKETNFTVSIEAAKGVTTGISAADRAKTIQVAVAKNSKSSDLVQPGHVFPLMARDGGVLVRAGHTEAGCDLARLAGLEPSAVIVEILNADGTMARKKDLLAFSKKNKLKIGTIEDLIKYRIQNEKTIKRVDEFEIETVYGKFYTIFYEDILTKQIHFVLIKGKISKDQPTLVRVHVQNILTDNFKIANIQGWPLEDALKKISKSKQGAAVIITKNTSIDSINIMKNLIINNKRKKDTKYDEQRTIGIGAQILKDIGVKQMALMSAPKIYHGISAFGLDVIKYVRK
ncbi:MAG: 3,4-dihydroxy-2-butanone-4-phosphate synthase [Pseudomonadota bacterium]|nr:3,4-dihydroxy-2-butanone-4-phosphate synthase [Pseudomonadota bacterium]MEC8996566.1 3,4-dihydroxy-2-butanone-4-phosphate synthase [Pseudomonadota bacterium]MED5429773.1 3,4-dihydroxy-2-butanone-4-phosphate synthase [Pseudomonadota bacterium]|tara:strand:+ start:1006 stop:2097 length:1092 start_codon:yes stop_codon:yes gene_type:complete